MLNGLSWLYGKIIDSRNSLYSRQLLKSKRLPAVTISIGNLTVGGTGKTPLVRFLAEYLSGKGESVCIISRGYKRLDESKMVLVSDGKELCASLEDSGDEPYELGSALIGKSIVIADRDRLRAAEWADQKFEVSVFLLDDAFQHRRVFRDLDIVVVDGTNPFGNRRTLPAGILREPISGIARADVALVTRADLAKDLKSVVSDIREAAPELKIFDCRNEIANFRALDPSTPPFESGGESEQKPVFAFCAIGNPSNFFGHLVAQGLNITGLKAFPDHHSYTDSDITEIERECSEEGADILVTTPKDAVKLEPGSFDTACFICENDLRFTNKKGFLDIVDKALISYRK